MVIHWRPDQTLIFHFFEFAVKLESPFLSPNAAPSSTRVRARFGRAPPILLSVVGDSGTDITGTTDITGLGENPGTVRQVEVGFRNYVDRIYSKSRS